jgi:hypothetical protein
MNEILETGKSLVVVTAGLAATLAIGVVALALVLNLLKVVLF